MRRALAIGVAAGLAVGLAGAPEEAWMLAWLAPGWLVLGLERPDGGAIPVRHAALMGLACGFATNAWTMRWAVGLFERYAMFPWPLAALVATLLWVAQAAPWAIACGLAAAIGRRVDRALPVALVVASSLVPMIFPWRPGVSQTGWLAFVQCAELGGPPLVDALFLVGACAAMRALRWRDRRAAVLASACIVLPWIYGSVRIDEVRAEREAAPPLRVGLMQHGLGIEARANGVGVAEDHRAMRVATAALEAGGAELVVWPEAAYGFGWRRTERDDPTGADGFFQDGVHGPLLVGAISDHWYAYWNSVLALEDHHVTAIADKVHLMTFTEEVPFWDELPPLQQVVPRGMTRGEVASEVLAVAGTRVGILVCFEDLVPEHAREVTALGAALLTNHTNDAWFGDTAAPHLHRFLSTMRAIETRRDLARVVGTGPSGLTDATGRRDVGTPTFTPARVIVEAHLLHGITPWVRLGDVVTLPALTLLLVLVLDARRRLR